MMIDMALVHSATYNYLEEAQWNFFGCPPQR